MSPLLAVAVDDDIDALYVRSTDTWPTLEAHAERSAIRRPEER
jgi:hypothetical protein